MRRTTFRSRATSSLLIVCLGAALVLPTALVPSAGAQEGPTSDPTAGGSAADRTDAKGGRVLSRALEQLADVTVETARRGDEPVPASGAQVQSQLAELSLPSQGAGSMMVREDGRVVVNINVTGADDATIAGIEAAGAVIITVSAEYGIISAEVGAADLSGLAAAPGVLAVTEVLTPMTSANASPAQFQPVEGPPVVGTNVVCATNPTGIKSEGDAQLSVATARANSAVDGSGVRIGVLSDTYSRTTFPTSAATDVANAELPGAANPCGNTTAVQVLDPGPASGSDEGRAMAQIVHDLAPKSPLAFSSAFNGDLDFADEIRALQAAGSKVIVDDVSYYNEPFYQDGPIAKAVNDVTAAGATYFSSAGNSTPASVPNGGSYEATSYRNMACPPAVLAVDPGYTGCHDFDTVGADAMNNMTIPNNSQIVTTLGWNEPMFGVGTDLDYFLIRVSDGAVLTASVGINSNTKSPVEVMGWPNMTGSPAAVAIVIAKFGAGGTPRLKSIVHRNPATFVQFSATVNGDVAGPTVFGHNAMLAAGSIAAVPYNNANTVEPFSSRGPATYCWQPVNGTSPSASMPCQTKNLDVAATDGVSNSFFGGFSAGAYRFYGTSASAPHAAAIAALQTQKRPCRTPAQILAAQRSSAVAFAGFALKDYGSGRVTATTAITGLTPCVGSGYHPVTPLRILDSREPNVGFSGKVTHPAEKSLQVTGLGGPSNVPANATAVVMNVTAADATNESFLTVFPTGTTVPNASNLNFGAGQTIPNLVTVKLGTGGKVQFANAVGATHVIADVVGYYDDGTGPGDLFTGITPVRLLDSRISTGGWVGPLPSGPGRDLMVRKPGNPNGVPATATTVVANVTVTGGTAQSFLKVWPSGETSPNVSNLNLLPGQTIPNLVTVKIGTNGAVKISNKLGSVHVILDVVGYFDPTAGSRFYAINPNRILDTRTNKGLSGAQGQGQTRPLAVAGVAGTNVPAGATGLVANVTVADATTESFVSVFPGNVSLPIPFSNLNFGSGQVIPNLVAVGIAPNGSVNFYNHVGSTALIADAVGYFAAT